MNSLADRFHTPLKAKTLVRFALAVAAFVGAYIGYLQLSANIHVVVPGVVYRSSQPSPATLVKLHEEYGIRTVLNLRGPNAGRSWYDNEVAMTRELNMTHIDFGMSAARELTTDEARKLMEIMANAEKPLLIHCLGGADRTGLASAIYLAGVAKGGEFEAEKQISLTYGHFSIFFMRAYAMDRTFERLEPMFGFPES